MILFFTDGSFRKSENKGGLGVVGFDGEKLIYAYQEQKEGVTNNQMELEAILKACEIADSKYPNEPITIYSDSQYCVKSINDWSLNWAKNGWKTANKQPIKNIELMKNLYKKFYSDFYHCRVEWIKGHENIWQNELADALATCNSNKFTKILLNHPIIIKTNIDSYEKI